MKEISKINLKTFENKIKNSPPAILRTINYLENISKQYNMQLFYFGGFLRDTWLNREPRDIDIVYNSSDKTLFENLTKDFTLRKTRFGGLKLNYENVEIDAWEIESTSAYKTQGFSFGPHRLPETTFFNIESIVLEVYAPSEKWGWENEFFEGCKEQKIAIQKLEEIYKNPFPELQIIRSLELKDKLGWNLENNLKEYIKNQLPKTNPQTLAKIYLEHYSKEMSPAKLKEKIESIIKE